MIPPPQPGPKIFEKTDHFRCSHIAGAPKGLVLKVSYRGDQYMIDEASDAALDLTSADVQKRVDRELNRLAVTQVEDDVIYQKVKRQEDLKQWKIDNKQFFHGGERTMKWKGDFIDTPGTMYERDWVHDSPHPTTKQSWSDVLRERGLFSPDRANEGAIIRSKRVPQPTDHPGMYAKRTTKTENLGQLRELYQQYDGTTANWAPRWVGGVVPGRSATPLVARGVVSQLAGQDQLNLTSELMSQNRMCITPLGTLRHTHPAVVPAAQHKGHSLGRRQHRGVQPPSRAVSRAGPPSRAVSRAGPPSRAVSRAGPPSASRCKSPERAQLQQRMATLMRDKQRGLPVQKQQMEQLIGELAEQAHMDRRSNTPKLSGIRGVPSAAAPYESCRLDAIGRHFGVPGVSVAWNHGGRTRKDESFRKTRTNTLHETISPSPI